MSNRVLAFLTAPWTYYTRTAAFIFSAVFATNFATSIYDPKRRQLLTSNPAFTTGMICAKSAVFAPLWPAWYTSLLFQPTSATFLFGGSVSNMLLDAIIAPTPGKPEQSAFEKLCAINNANAVTFDQDSGVITWTVFTKPKGKQE